MTREELREALMVLIDVFKNPHGTLTPDYGEICGDGFQMMTMHPDPVAVANALSRLPDILASLDIEADPTPTPEQVLAEAAPIPMILHCPECGGRHIDEGVFADKPHHTHACQHCGMVWRPAKVDTCGVQFLPGYSNVAPIKDTRHD